ncbi:hypothetical protein LRS10_18250 [Phenylobacterium sp. J426]|uniref:hypothetical protein n=1 Tax=Phenylobacterium sp. J426 TaxID=2898439 RepID=UPI002150C12B|nr:hypothetical protein [Phenylobacterium sp. J426]MCR5875922.1 hypothetical protein [Phenylobacterium sp. J426]
MAATNPLPAPANARQPRLHRKRALVAGHLQRTADPRQSIPPEGHVGHRAVAREAPGVQRAGQDAGDPRRSGFGPAGKPLYIPGLGVDADALGSEPPLPEITPAGEHDGQVVGVDAPLQRMEVRVGAPAGQTEPQFGAKAGHVGAGEAGSVQQDPPAGDSAIGPPGAAGQHRRHLA